MPRIVAILGVGSLGVRHLQSLCESSCPTILYCFDISESSLKAAYHGFHSNPRKSESCKLVLAKNLTELPKKIDLAIIATSADVRLSILKSLLTFCELRYLLLEKVLFQRLADYVECANLIKRYDVETYVNCPRRIFDVYKEIKNYFSASRLRLMTVSGGEWGLGCNGIHFIDLFSFLSGGVPDRWFLNVSVIKESKRPGFFEFTGTMCGVSSAGQIVLAAGEGCSPRMIISLLSAERLCVVDELDGFARIYFKEKLEREIRFRLPFQSEITLSVVDRVLSGDFCGLTPYAESMEIHLPFVSGIIEEFSKVTTANPGVAPIT